MKEQLRFTLVNNLLALTLTLSAVASDNEAILTSTSGDKIRYVKEYKITDEKVTFRECKRTKDETIPKDQVVIFEKKNACVLVDAALQADFVRKVILASKGLGSVTSVDVRSPFALGNATRENYKELASGDQTPKEPVRFIKGNDFKVIMNVIRTKGTSDEEQKDSFFNSLESKAPVDRSFLDIQLSPGP